MALKKTLALYSGEKTIATQKITGNPKEINYKKRGLEFKNQISFHIKSSSNFLFHLTINSKPRSLICHIVRIEVTIMYFELYQNISHILS